MNAAKAARTEALKDRKALKNELRRAEREVEALEKEIPALESEQSGLLAQLSAAETPAEERGAAGRRLKAVEESLAARLAAWEEAGSRRDELAHQLNGQNG